MTTMMVHFHRVTGNITNWGSDDGSTESFLGPDYDIARFDDWHAVDVMRQRIDPRTWAIVNRTSAEIATAMLPLVRVAVAVELDATDRYMVPDRPLGEALRQEWKQYRQALRELDGDAVAILDAWPLRPDLTDAAAPLRTQMREIEP